MAAAGHKIGKADLIDLAQVRMLDPLTVGRFNYFLDIDLAPAKIGKRDLGIVPVGAEPLGVIAREPGSIGQLDDRTELVEAGHLVFEAHLAEPAEIDEIILV